MEITQPVLSHKEAKFESSELFFSITDLDSTIRSGNEVFIRISGYDKQETIGRYHNIVRHPDMPRVVFKVLWDSLKRSQPIAGYVKNRTKSGEYYWVFAALFPLPDRIVSIRVKPTSPLFEAIQEVYPILKEAESRGGMESSEMLINSLLNDLGYNNYEQFMADALLQELKGRQRSATSLCALDSERVEAHSMIKQLKPILAHTNTLMQTYDKWFEKIDMFVQVKSVFEEKSLILRQIAREVVFLSLNASVSSYRIERGGETFGILARDVRTNAKENDELIAQIDLVAKELSDSLNALVFSVSGIRLQCEMLAYFVEELLCEHSNNENVEIERNMETLIMLVTEYSHKSDELQIGIERKLQESLKHLDQLEKQMMYLGYIQIYGIIEAAGSSNEQVSFEGIFSQLKTLIQKTSVEIAVMQKMGGNFYMENRRLMEESNGIETLLHSLYHEIECIKQMQG